MAKIKINILNSRGEITSTKEINDYELEAYKKYFTVQTVTTQPITAQIKQPITTEVQNILNLLNTGTFTYPSWFENNITWVKSGQISSQEFVNAYNNLISQGIIIVKTTSPIPPVIISPVIIPPIVTPTQTITAQAQSIINILASGNYQYPSWFNQNITWVKAGQISSQEFIEAYNYLKNQGSIIDITVQPVIIPPVIIPSPIVIPPIPTPITITTEAQNIINLLDSGKFTYPSWFNQNITWVKSGEISNQEFIDAYNNLKSSGLIIDIIPTNEEINPNSVRLSGKNFEIDKGKIQGQITLEKIEGSWNPYYNDMNLALVVQYKDINTGVTMDLVPYVVKFPQGFGAITNQVVNIERSTAFHLSNYARINIEIYLWKSLDNPIAFSDMLKFTLDADKLPIDIITKPQPIKNDFMSKAVGVFGGLLGLSLLITGSKNR